MQRRKRGPIIRPYITGCRSAAAAVCYKTRLEAGRFAFQIKYEPRQLVFINGPTNDSIVARLRIYLDATSPLRFFVSHR